MTFSVATYVKCLQLQNGASGSNLLPLGGISPAPSPLPPGGGGMGGGLNRKNNMINRKRKLEEDVSVFLSALVGKF